MTKTYGLYWLGALGLLLFASCTTGGSGSDLDPDSDGDAAVQCTEDIDCDPGSVCDQGLCVAQTADGDLPDGDTSDGDAKLPGLTVPTVVDFGSVPIGASAEREFAIGNVGKADLVITSFGFDRATSEEFALLEGPAADTVVPPEQSVTVKLSYTPVDIGEDSGLAVLYTNDPDNPIAQITLMSGYKGTPLLVAEPEAVEFPLTEMGQTAQAVTVTLKNEIDEGGNRVIRITDLYLESRTGQIFDLQGVPTGDILLSPALPVSFQVVFHPNTADAFTDTLVIEADSGVTDGALRIPVSGEGGAGRVELQPGSVAFGSIDVGQTSPQAVLVRNVGAFPLTVREIVVSGTAFALESVLPEADETEASWTVAPGDFLTASVTFTPDQPGDRTGQLVVRSSDPVSPTVTANLFGTGQQAGLILTPQNVLFTDTRLNAQSDRTVTVRKADGFTGELRIVSLTIQSVTLDDVPWTGEAPFVFTQPESLPLVLADNSEHTWTFRFTALMEGHFEAQAVLETEPALSSSPMLSLSGLGVSPHLNPDLAGGMPLAFGEVRLGETRNRSLVLTNGGTTTLTVSHVGLGETTAAAYTISSPAATSFTLNPSQSQTVTIQLTLADGDPTGDTSGTLTVQSDDPDNPTLSWPLTAWAINPKLSVLPAHDPFHLLGNVPLGATSETRTFTIAPAENSFGPLIISNIRLPQSNDQGYVFEGLSGLTFPITLNQATPETASLSFGVRYVTRQEGSFWADVEIESNDLLQPFHAVRMKVNVTTCELSQILCDNQCVEALTAEHCNGEDGCTPCPAFNDSGSGAAPECRTDESGQGICELACTDEAWDDCNGVYEDGCETNIRTDVNHCGVCGSPCQAVEHGTPFCADLACDFVCEDEHCKIGDACVPSGTLNPENTCEVCDPLQDATAYSLVNDTTICDDGLFCTVLETCSAGACENGAPRDCTPFVTLTVPDCQAASCNEAEGSCDIAPANEGGDCSQDGFSDGWTDTGDLGPGCADRNDPVAHYLDYACLDGACVATQGETRDCNLQDGLVGGGDTAGCGADPAFVERDYYATEAGDCVFSTAGCRSGSCDDQDLCAPVCDGTRRMAYKDFFAQSNSDQCTFAYGSLLEDCVQKTSVDTDGGPDAYLVGGIVTDYDACQDGVCIGQTRSDYCIGNTLYEYGANGTGFSGPSLKSCTDFETFYCDGTGRFVYRDRYTCTGDPGACNNSASDTMETDCGASTCIGTCGGGLNGCMYTLRGCASGQCFTTPQDADGQQSNCTGCGLSWNLGGEVSASTCCGDDFGEVVRTCQDSSNNGNCGLDTQACCSSSDRCVDHLGACLTSGQCAAFGTSNQKSYCEGGVWQDPDESQTFCEAAGCGFAWLPNVPGGTGCCGDDQGEDLEQNEAAGRTCCYNGAVLASGTSQGSMLCYNGQLYDCNDAASDDSGLATPKVSCDAVGARYCSPSNTWTATKSDGCACSQGTECQSGTCRSDYDATGAWCAQSTQCAHNGVVINNGQASPDCYDAGARAVCTNGVWGVASCGTDTACTDYACSSGACTTTHQGTNVRCNDAFACSSGTGDNRYAAGGGYRCQGYCDGAGACDYAGSCDDCGDNYPGAAGLCNSGTCSMGSCLSGYANCDGDPLDCETLEAAGTCADNSIDIGSVDTNLYENTFLLCATTSCETGHSRSERGEGWYKIYGENDTGCDDGNKLWVRLQSPATMDYDLFLYDECGHQVASSQRGTGQLDEVTHTWGAFSRYMWIEIRYYGGNACDNWTLQTKGGCPSGW